MFNFSGKQWAVVSKEAKDLVQKMLTKDPRKRITAEEAWNDPWIQMRSKGLVADKEIDSRAMQKLLGFRANSRIQQATLQYIASNLTTSQQIDNLRKAFTSIDKNGDGHLTLSELKQGYETLTLSSSIKLEEILKRCDSDLNGMIDYNEFITATISWQKHLSQKLLESAFKAYDRDKSGTISLSEIKDFLGGQGTSFDNVWKKILHDADTNGDGVIDLEEFKNIMLWEIESNTLL